VRAVDGSDYVVHRAVTRVKTRLSNVVALLRDNQGYPVWRHGMSRTKLLKRLNPQESMTYIGINMPWPARDRDAVLHSTWHQDPETLVVTKIEVAEPHYVKASKEYQRIPVIESKWTLTPLSEGWVEVMHESYTDPGGDAPDWMVEYLSVEVPYHTLSKLRAFDLDHYQLVHYAFIEEPRSESLMMGMVEE